MHQEPLNITEPAFPARQDGPALYPVAGQQQAIAGLRQAIQDRQHVLCLTGQAGSGKTALLHALHQSLDQGVVGLIAQPVPGRLLNDLANALGLETSDETESSLRRRLVMLLAAADQQRRPIIQLVDDADRLSTVDLGLLLHFFPRGHATLVLAGEGAPDAWLAGCATATGPVLVDEQYRLEPWSEEETTGYVRYRLQRDGLPGTLLMPAAIAAMHRQSGGLPGLVDRLYADAVGDAGTPEARDTAVSTRPAPPPISAEAGADHSLPDAPVPRLSPEAIDRISAANRATVPQAAEPAAARSEDQTAVRRPAPDAGPAAAAVPGSADRRSAEALVQARMNAHIAPASAVPPPSHAPAPRLPSQDSRAEQRLSPLQETERMVGVTAPRPTLSRPAHPMEARGVPAQSTAGAPQAASQPLPVRTRRLRRSARRWRALAILSSLALAAVLTQDLWLERLPTNRVLLERLAEWFPEPPDADAPPQSSAPVPTPTERAAPAEPQPAETDADFAAVHPPSVLRKDSETPLLPSLPGPDTAPEENAPAISDGTVDSDRTVTESESPDTPTDMSIPESPPLTQAQREDVARLYAERAEYEWRRGELDAAYLSIQRGLASDPTNPKLLELRALFREVTGEP